MWQSATSLFLLRDGGKVGTRRNTEGHGQQGEGSQGRGRGEDRALTLSALKESGRVVVRPYGHDLWEMGLRAEFFGGFAFGEVGGQFYFGLVGGELYDFAVATDDDLGIGSARFYDDLFAGFNECQFGQGCEGVGAVTVNH